MPAGSAGGAPGTSRRHYWGILLLLALCCSGLYVLLYYRVALASTSAVFFPRPFSWRSDSSSSSNTSASVSSPSVRIVSSNSTLAASQSQSAASDYGKASPDVGKNTSARGHTSSPATALKDAISKGESVPLLTLFSTWVERKELELVRNLTLHNWQQLKPYTIPLLFTNDSKMAAHAREYGWHTLSVSKTAIGVPILKNMYLDAMQRFNTTLYAYANGDILFTEGLVDSLTTIVSDQALPLPKKPLMVIGQRTNVPMVTAQEASTLANISKVAKARGKLFITMAEDFFITDRHYPWDEIPGVVVGRVAYDNWLVLHAIQSGHVVVDITKTSPAVHQTTKAGNYEGFTHANSSYNDNVLKRVYKRIQYMRGCVDCSPWRTMESAEGIYRVEKRLKKPKHC